MSDEVTLFDEIRDACAEVTRRARMVRIDDGGLDRFASLLARERPRMPETDPAQQRFPDNKTTIAFILTINAINFGSGWFPTLNKREGMSGYLTIASSLRDRFLKEGPWSSRELEKLTPEDCAALFGQPTAGDAFELMTLYAQALNELGAFLAREHRGRFEGPVEDARFSAERLVRMLAEMPFYRDVSQYEDLEVPFYKRAQITCSDLAHALRHEGLGRFDDVDQLTLFADNLVPHTLRMLGVLQYDLLLERRIESGELLEPGSEVEVEIRAVGLHAVERLVESCGRRGWKVNASRLDHLLWSRGQSPAIKAKKRHRARTTWY